MRYVVRMTRGRGSGKELWHIVTDSESDEAAQALAEEHAPTNGKGWKFDGFEPDGLLPQEREP